jgi:hypothetical protein
MSNTKSLHSLFVSKNNVTLDPKVGGLEKFYIVNKTVIANIKKHQLIKNQ